MSLIYVMDFKGHCGSKEIVTIYILALTVRQTLVQNTLRLHNYNKLYIHSYGQWPK